MSERNLQDIHSQLSRIAADDVRVGWEEEIETAVGKLLKVELGEAQWRLVPEEFVALLEELPDNAGDEAVKEKIESDAHLLGRGPDEGLPEERTL